MNKLGFKRGSKSMMQKSVTKKKMKKKKKKRNLKLLSRRKQEFIGVTLLLTLINKIKQEGYLSLKLMIRFSHQCSKLKSRRILSKNDLRKFSKTKNPKDRRKVKIAA